MKMQAKWLVLSALLMGLGACGKKEQPAETGSPTPPETVETVAETTPVPEPVIPELPEADAPDRIAKIGFAKHLPSDTEALVSFYNGAKHVERIQTLKAWTLLTDSIMGGFGGGMDEFEFEMEDEDFPGPDLEIEQEDETGDEDFPFPEEDPDDLEMGMEGAGPGLLLGTEVTVAFGKTSGEQLGHLLTFNNRSGYFQMLGLTRALARAAQENDPDVLTDETDAMWSEIFPGLLNDPESGLDLLARTNVPPVYIAFRTTEEQQEIAAQQVASSVEMMEMFDEIAEPLEIERNGSPFIGYKISGAAISESMEEELRPSMEESMDPATVDRLLEVISQKDIVVVSGVLGDYVVLFIGGSEEDLRFADDAGESLAGSSALDFADAYADKDLVALAYGEKNALHTLTKAAGGLSQMARGIRDGLSGSEGLGDTRDLEALLQLVVEREATVLNFTTTETSGVAAFIEEGLKIESHGGSDSGAIDWKTPLKLAHLGDSDEVVFFANMASDAAYSAAASAYFDSLLETAYAMTLKASRLPFESGEMTSFKEWSTRFDEEFRVDAAALWEALSGDFPAGLGTEGAVVMDLQAAMPAFPGLPQEVVDHAKFPRISMIAPVTDRSKLSESWEKINGSSTSLLAKISEITGKDIAMQRLLSSERNAFTSWFFPVPFSHDDFIPSVTLSDEWFAASSSRLQALALLEKIPAGNEDRTGLWIRANFRAVRQFAADTLQVVEDHADAIFKDLPEQKENFEENKPQIRELIGILDDFDQLTIHSRMENEGLRTSIHFKTR